MTPELDLKHPDFQGRTIQSQSFITGESVQDINGHGTHCIGTACGPLNPGVGPRYGVAHQAEIFAGKVLGGRAGRGSDGAILNGINWAIRNRCQVISMSLGRRVQQGERPTQNYEVAGRRKNRQFLNNAIRSWEERRICPRRFPSPWVRAATTCS